MEQPGTYRITLYQGATFDQQFIWKIDNTPVDLSTYTARMQVRRNFDAPDTIVDLTEGDGIELGASGQIDIYIDANETTGLPRGSFVYDLELESNSGEVTRLLQGGFVVSPEVTR
jgi:hypothetical protein